MEHSEQYIRGVVARGGPVEADYAELDAWMQRLHQRAETGNVPSEEVVGLRAAFGEAFTPSTLQGYAFNKPHGYAGDFEIIDRIYRRHISPAPHLARWDHFWQQHAASQAVRNRKTYFHDLLDQHVRRKTPLRVLNVASGPGRCMFEWLSSRPDAAVSFDCIELDPDAIAHATSINELFRDRITFHRKNALRYRPAVQYDVVWSAGLFDYFNDKVFLDVFKRLYAALAPGGELVIGNFSPANPSRAYMELLDWTLHHRDADALRSLAAQADISRSHVRIGSEPRGVNLFLHVTRTSAAAATPAKQTARRRHL